MYKRFVKRLLDVTLSILALTMLSPLLLIIVVLEIWKQGWPIIFYQQRPGLKGKPFTIYKFRTMTDAKDKEGYPLSDEQRLTSFGKFLRATSLDELPELINVLKGDMSLVGPRPLMMEYLEYYSTEQTRRHEVRPGITGWAQINGRNAISWEKKFQYDVWYVENVSITLDIYIIFKTLGVIFDRRGISADNHVTMPKFRGTNNPHTVDTLLDSKIAED